MIYSIGNVPLELCKKVFSICEITLIMKNGIIFECKFREWSTFLIHQHVIYGMQHLYFKTIYKMMDRYTSHLKDQLLESLQ